MSSEVPEPPEIEIVVEATIAAVNVPKPLLSLFISLACLLVPRRVSQRHLRLTISTL